MHPIFKIFNMKKISILALFLIGVLMSFSTDLEKKIRKIAPSQKENVYPMTFNDHIYQNFEIPFVGKSFVGFKEALGFKESQGLYHIVNELGYMGKYQFGKNTLKLLKIYSTSEYLRNPELQEDSFLALCQFNKWVLRKDIKRSVGKIIKSIPITESGILAAAHLAGAGNVKRFLRSNGNYTFKDAFGSSINHYLRKFSGYDTFFIEPNRFPTIES